MLKVELENLLKKEGYISNFRILSLCSDQELDNMSIILEDMLKKRSIEMFIKDGVHYYKEATRILC